MVKRVISLLLVFTLNLYNFAFLIPLFNKKGVLAWETTDSGIIYYDGEAWCEGDTSKVCTRGRIESTPCGECENGYCTLSPTPSPPPPSGCGHLYQKCCKTTPRCFEGNPIRQGFLGLFGCKCLLEGKGVTLLHINTSCNYPGQIFCQDRNINECYQREDGNLSRKSAPCYFRHCMNDIYCAETPLPTPTSTPTPTPTPIIIQCDYEGKLRCSPDGDAIQKCIRDCSTEMLLWRTVNVCPGGCNEETKTCRPYCPESSICYHPGEVKCKNGWLVYCGENRCTAYEEECLYGCNEDVTPNHCYSFEEVASVKPGESFHFNDLFLRWDPLVNILTRLFYEKMIGALYTPDSGRGITTQNVLADLDLFLLQNPAYRCITPETLQFAAVFLGAFLFLSASFSPIIISHMQALPEFTSNVHVSTQITYAQFVQNANSELVREIKLVAQENPDIYIILRSSQEFEELRQQMGYSNLWGMTWNSGPNGVQTGSGFIPPKTPYIEIGYHAPVGIPSHELGHIITNRTGVSEKIYDVLGKLGVNAYNVPSQPYREVVATLEAQRFLVSHNFPIPPESIEYLRHWQDELYNALKLLLNF